MTAHSFRSLIVVLLTALLLPGALHSQPANTISREQTAGSPISYDFHVARADTSFSVYIPFRIRHDFFVFIRPDGAAAQPFAAGGEVSVEMLNETGTSVSRTIQRMELTSQKNTTADLRTQYYQDLLTMSLPAGRYTIVFTLEDKESKRMFTESRRIVEIPAGDSAATGLVPVQPNNDDTFTLFNLGGDVHFSRDHAFLIQTNTPYSSAKYSLTKLGLYEEDNEPLVADSSIAITALDASSFRAAKTSSGIGIQPVRSGSGALLLASFNGALLRQGRYELTLTFPDSTVRKSTFSARWLDMPLSLNDLDLAVEPLQFIMTKKEYSEVRRGSRESRIRNFDEFWRKKDATPATAYNEVMHEFYRRVDVAVTSFRTLKEMNGAITDRGRIYVMYGPPASTERLLAPDGAPKEIWNYPTLKKVFTFEDPARQGNYKLIN